MDNILFDKLYADGVLSTSSVEKIKSQQQTKLFSLHWEIKVILYLGVLLLSGGIGMLIYKNIDSIGHTAILLFLIAVCTGSFFYCFTNKAPFSTNKVSSPNAFFDYILLLACLTFVTLVGYMQFQYHVFGNRYGLATFVPMIILFCTAYYFDNLAILSLAITSLAAWAGIAVTPAAILQDNDFNNSTIIITGLALGAVLLAAGFLSAKQKIKAHFDFTYSNFGAHILFISCLAAMFYFNSTHLIWFVLLAAISYAFYLKAIKEKSFYFLLIMSLYLYIGVTYVIMRFLFNTASLDIGGVYLAFIYFIASAIGLIIFLIKMNRKFKAL